jgi:hypothetical protein
VLCEGDAGAGRGYAVPRRMRGILVLAARRRDEMRDRKERLITCQMVVVVTVLYAACTLQAAAARLGWRGINSFNCSSIPHNKLASRTKASERGDE